MILKTVIDADNSALFVIWTVLDYPKGFDLELDDLPDAIRSLDEVIKDLMFEPKLTHFHNLFLDPE